MVSNGGRVPFDESDRTYHQGGELQEGVSGCWKESLVVVVSGSQGQGTAVYNVFSTFSGAILLGTTI